MTAALPSPVIAQLDCAIYYADFNLMKTPETQAPWIARSSRAMTESKGVIT